MGPTARPSGYQGYDTFSPCKLVGGIAKSCPDARDLENVPTFFREMKDCLR